MEFGTLKPRHRNNKVSSQSEATWKYTIPTILHRALVQELWRTQMPHFVALLEAVEKSPSFYREWQPRQLVPISREVSYTSTSEVASACMALSNMADPPQAELTSD